MNRLITIAFSSVLCMGLFVVMAGKFMPAPAAPVVTETQASARPASAMALEEAAESEATVLRRDGSGQFHIQGQVNGAEIPFLVDTGADVVALTVETAEAAGIHVDPSAFEPIMQTASGPGNAARVQLANFEVAGRHFQNIDAVVVEGLSTDLLGQSVLRRLGRVELKGDKMVIERN